MSTPLRLRRANAVRHPIAALMLLGLFAGGATRSSAEIVLGGLANPTGLAVRSALHDGGVEVFAADAENGRIISSIWRDGEASSPRVVLDELPRAPTLLRWLSKKELLVASESIAVYVIDGEEVASEPKSVARWAKGQGLIGSVAVNARFVYAVSDGQLLRARRVGERLTSLRATPNQLGAVAAIAFSPRGYLVVLHRSTSGEAPSAWQLAFLDPEQPDKPVAVLPVTGLRQPTQLAYGFSDVSDEGLLYVLDPGADEPQGGGVYRIDAAFDDSGRSTPVVRLLVSVEQPSDFAIGPEGALYVATRSEGGGVIRGVPSNQD